jgi:hypothetical protein
VDWVVALIAAAAVVVVVVVLLLAILLMARRILTAATRSLNAVERIRQNTLPLWELGTTNEVAGDLLNSANSIRRRVEALAGALESAQHGGGR